MKFPKFYKYYLQTDIPNWKMLQFWIRLDIAITSAPWFVYSGQKHKKSLEKLKESDPEFYEFLKNEDKNLLDFEGSDESDESEDEDEDDEKGKKHKPPKKLEVSTCTAYCI